MDKRHRWTGLRIIFEYLGNQKITYIILTCFSNVIVSVCYNIVLAVIMQKVLDGIIYRNRTFLYQGALIALVSFAAAFIFEPIFSRIRNNCVRSTIMRIREKVFCSITEMPVRTYETMGQGDILTKITNDIETLEDIYLYHLLLLSFALIHGGIATVLMLFYNVPLGIFSLLSGIMQSAINYKTSTKVEQAAQNRQKSRVNMLQTVIDTLDGHIDIRLSGSESFFEKTFWKKNLHLTDHEKTVEKKKALIENTDNLFEHLNYVAILGLGLCMMLNGNITFGTIVAIKSLQGNATYLFSNLSAFMSGIAEAMPSVNRIAGMLDMPKMTEGMSKMTESMSKVTKNVLKVTKTQENVSKLSDAETAVEMWGVSFGYNSQDEVLCDLTCRIKKGTLTVVTGNSGEGKSTWLKLLLGFYDFSEGTYFLFGKDTQKQDKQMIRCLIAYVDQSCTLFSMSVADNVRLGRLNAVYEDVVEACRAAGAHEFIEDLPDKYDTLLIGGENLSGGQRQRIALARAFVSEKPILLIDEGTASLDMRSEEKIIDSIVKMKGKRTVIIVSHRKAWEERADAVYRLREKKFR